MLRRTVTALVLLLIILPAVHFGGLAYFVVVAAFVVLAAGEYVQMFQTKGFDPSAALVMAAVLLILAWRAFWPDGAGTVLAACVMAALAFHMFRYERGRDSAALDFAIALGGISYLGWVAAHLIDLRSLPNGAFWLLLVFVIVWVTDSLAYFVGVRFGRHKMSARLSPKKSWEGYVGGVLAGTAVAGLLAVSLTTSDVPHLALLPTLGLGLILSSLTTLGDFGESLFKRYAGVKDSGSILPGHGGAFDRIDSLIWASALGYYWIRYLML